MTEEEVSLLLFQTIENIIEDLMKGKIWRNLMKGFVNEASPSYSHEGCSHSATHAYPQRNTFPIDTARGMEGET